MPLFAPPTIAAGAVYVADLARTVHAIDLKKGEKVWTFPLAKEIGVSSMVYGGITVHGGKLFLGTCNLEGPNIGKGTAVVCIGNKQ
jgi:outer membrane protein assembly factor BamB